MCDTLEFVIDDQLRDELDKAKHVDSLGQGGDDERVPAAMGPKLVRQSFQAVL